MFEENRGLLNPGLEKNASAFFNRAGAGKRV